MKRVVHCLLLLFLVAISGCTSVPVSSGSAKVSHRYVGQKEGDSVYLVDIQGHTFEHKSSTGGIRFMQDRKHHLVMVQVGLGRGTYAGFEIGHIYHISHSGKVNYCGQMQLGWYEDETWVETGLAGFEGMK